MVNVALRAGPLWPLLVLAFYSAPAAADQLPPAPQVEINLHGTLPEQCAMGNPGGVDFGDLNRPNLSADVDVSLYCNVPFTISVEAQNGALTNERSPNGEGPYAGQLPYNFGLTVPVRLPASSTLEDNFDSRALVAGKSLSSGGGIALDGMRLHVALGSPPSAAGLLAGNYSETIVITVAPS